MLIKLIDYRKKENALDVVHLHEGTESDPGSPRGMRQVASLERRV